MIQIFKGFISSIEVDNQVFRVCIPQLDNFVTHPIEKRVGDLLGVGDGVEVLFYDAELTSGYITAKLG